MAPHRVLLTGASGYLGGSLLSRWQTANLPAHDKLYALVRSDMQRNAVRAYGAEPLTFDASSKSAVEEAISHNKITVVLFLIDAVNSEAQINFIEALAKLRDLQGGDVHFIHTSGAKIFSSHAGAPADGPLVDDDPELYYIQKKQKSNIVAMARAVTTNNTIVEQCEPMGVNCYIFIPCIVYGKGEGFGNLISIQTRAVVKAAKAVGRVCSVDPGRPSWPICHLEDNTNLYLRLVEGILSDKKPPSGKNGYYLASSGSVAWEDIYSAFALSLAERGVIKDVSVQRATTGEIEQMGYALGVTADLVSMAMGGNCTLTARNGKSIGWSAQYKPQHILDSAQEEVDKHFGSIGLARQMIR